MDRLRNKKALTTFVVRAYLARATGIEPATTGSTGRTVSLSPLLPTPYISSLIPFSSICATMVSERRYHAKGSRYYRTPHPVSLS